MDRLTKKEKGFADDYLESGNATQAALNNYNTVREDSAARIGHDNTRKHKIIEYLASKAEAASSMVFQLSQEAEAEAVRLSASKDILDRAGYKPVEQTDVTSGGEKLEIGDSKLALKFDEFLKQHAKES